MTPAKETVRSVNDVPIRLTAERWRHITTAHPEMAAHYHSILKTIKRPDEVHKGKKGEMVALSNIGSNHYIVVVYRETTDSDGFVITAFKTSKPDTFRRGEQQWSSET